MNEAFEKWFNRTYTHFRHKAFVGPASSAWDAATKAATPQWQDISSAPKDREVWFWIVSLVANETIHSTSGDPILSSAGPHAWLCKYGHWSALSKAIYWHETPNRPKQ